MIGFAVTGPTAYWYLTRATGMVALILLTVTVALGILGTLRFARDRWPRFAVDALHRDISLLVLALIVIHVVTTVLDGFAPIGLLDAVIPFRSPYRPLWLGLGALAFDAFLALIVTSLMRRRLGYRAWRAVHWLAYASWPVTVLHGLGTGSDTKQGWALAVTFVCVAAVAGALVVRIVRTDGLSDGRRSLAVTGTVLTPVAIAAFTLLGPLASGWARRAGTPSKLLAHAGATSHPAAVKARANAAPAGGLKLPFRAGLSGSVHESSVPGGAVLDLALRLTGGVTGALRIRLAGQPDNSGGLSMTGSQVDLVAPGLSSALAGRITSLNGTVMTARLTGAGQPPVDLDAELNIDNGTGAVTGTVSGKSGR